MDELDEKAKVYHGLYRTMVTRFRAREYDEADDLANSLLLNADLPLIIRVLCHSILGGAGAPRRNGKKAHSNFLGHAQTALNLLNDAKKQGFDITDKRISEAERHVREAERDLARLKAEGYYDEPMEGEQESEEVGGWEDYDEDKIFANGNVDVIGGSLVQTSPFSEHEEQEEQEGQEGQEK